MTHPEVHLLIIDVKMSHRLETGKTHIIFSARYAERTMCYRPSVCLSITRVDQSRTVEVRIMQFSL